MHQSCVKVLAIIESGHPFDHAAVIACFCHQQRQGGSRQLLSLPLDPVLRFETRALSMMSRVRLCLVEVITAYEH